MKRRRSVFAKEAGNKRSKWPLPREESVLVLCAVLFVMVMLIFQPNMFVSEPSGKFYLEDGTLSGTVHVNDPLCSKDYRQYTVTAKQHEGTFSKGARLDSNWQFEMSGLPFDASTHLTRYDVYVSGRCADSVKYSCHVADLEQARAVFIDYDRYVDLPVVSYSPVRVAVSDGITGTGIKNAQVSWNTQWGFMKTGTTGSLFYIDIGSQPAGDITLTVSKEGYETRTVTRSVTGCLMRDMIAVHIFKKVS